MASSIVDYLGRPINTSDLTKEIAAPQLSGLRHIFYDSVSFSLTPERLAQILLAVDQNDTQEYLTLAEEMEERDNHYSSVLRTRKLAVGGLKVVVEAASDDPADVEIGDYVSDVLTDDMASGLIADLLDAIGKGYSVCELMWDTSEAQWEPRAYEWRDQRFFQFDRTTGQELLLRDTSNPYGIPLQPYKFVQHRPRLKTGLPIRGGLARLAVVSYMCKAYAVKDWMAFAEVFGMPIRLGKFGPSATPEQKAALLSAVTNIGTDAAAIIPDSMVMEFQQASSSSGGEKLFEGLASWFDSQVSKGVLGQTMTTDNGSSLSQAKVHDSVREDIKIDDAHKLAATLRRDLVKPLVDLNFGPPSNGRRGYPIVRLMTEEPEDLKLLAESLPPFIDQGLPVQASVILDKFGLEEPEPGALLLRPKALATPPSSAPGAVGGNPPTGNEQPPAQDEQPLPDIIPPKPDQTTQAEAELRKKKKKRGMGWPKKLPTVGYTEGRYTEGLYIEESDFEDATYRAEKHRTLTALMARVRAGEALTDDQRALLAAVTSSGTSYDLIDKISDQSAADWRSALGPLLKKVLATVKAAQNREELVRNLDELVGKGDLRDFVHSLAIATFEARALGDAKDNVPKG